MDHTPGPWDFAAGDLTVSANRLADEITKTLGSNADSEQAANFRLLECAPDLLAALKLAVRVLKDNDIDEAMAGEFELLTDAIAKAEGRDA